MKVHTRCSRVALFHLVLVHAMSKETEIRTRRAQMVDEGGSGAGAGVPLAVTGGRGAILALCIGVSCCNG